MANPAYQDKLTFVNTSMVGIADRVSNPSQFHPMVRNDWGTADKLRGLLGKYYAPIYPTNVSDLPSVVLLNYTDLYTNPLPYAFVQDINQNVVLGTQAVGTNQGTNLIFDYTIQTQPQSPGLGTGNVDGVITLTYSPAGWYSPGYNLTYPPAEYYFGELQETREDWWETIANRLSRYMGQSSNAIPHARIGSDPASVKTAILEDRSPVGTPIKGILSGSGEFIDYTFQLSTPSSDIKIRTKADERLKIESTYVQYVDSRPAFEDVISSDSVSEDLIPNAYYLQLELQNTGGVGLANGRYAKSMTLNSRVDWFSTRTNQLTENNRKRYYEEYARALNKTIITNTIDVVKSELASNKELFVLHADRDVLNGDAINPSAIPFYNTLRIPGAKSEGYKSDVSILGHITEQAEINNNNLIDLLQYTAIQRLQGPVQGVPFTQTLKRVNNDNSPDATYSLEEKTYTAVYNVKESVNGFLGLTPPPASQENPATVPESGMLENSMIIAQAIEDDAPVGVNEATSLHKRRLNMPTQVIDINPSLDTCLNILSDAREVTRPFEDVLNGEFCHTETLMYLVKKYKVGTNGEDLVQTFYFTNRFDNRDIIYYDSQIKTKQKYRYDIQKVIIVFGSKYSYTLPANNEGSLLFNTVPTVDDNAIGTFPSYQATLPYMMSPEYMQVFVVPHVVGGISVMVDDKPPVAPGISFYPLKGVNNKVKILLQPQTGIFEEKPIIIQNTDVDFFIAEYEAQTGQQVTTINEIDKIEFRSDDPVESYQLFKTTTKPTAYSDFAGQVISVDPQFGRAGSYDDYIRPNTIYYYCARAVDINGNISNPTHIFELEMIDNAGQIFLRQEVFTFESAKPKYTTEGRRFIYIEPGLQQLALEDPASAGMPNVNNPPNSSILGAPSISKVWDETFKIRVRSTKTGRKLDLNITFKNTGIVNPSE